MGVIQLKYILLTDLIIHQIKLGKRTKVYDGKYKKLTPDCKS